MIKRILVGICLAACAVAQTTGPAVTGGGQSLSTNINSPTNNQCLVYQASTNTWTNQSCTTGGGGSGTVTSVSVTSANGLSGTVANPTTTPAITLNASGLQLSQLATQSPGTILGNSTGSTATPTALTALPSALTTAGGGAPVGTTDTQTLTNKTLTSPAITGAFQGQTYTPSSMTTAGITDAANLAATNGGGIVLLPAGTYTLTAPGLPLLQGVYYQGVPGGQNAQTQTVQTNVGTWLSGDGTFPAFYINPTDQVTQAANQVAFNANVINGTGVSGVVLSNFSYGIKAGALWIGSFNNGIFENIICSGVAWCAWFENFQESKFNNLISQNHTVGGFVWANSGQSADGSSFIGGNSLVQHVFAQQFSTSPVVRNIEFRSRGWGGTGTNNSGMNDMNVDDIQTNQYGLPSSIQAATMTAPIATTITNGNAAIAATNSFSAGDPVGFSATVGTGGGQLATNIVYYVSATGLSGSQFEVSATASGSVITPNANGTPNVNVLKIGVTDGTQFILDSPVTFSASANGFTAQQIYFVTWISGNSIALGNAVRAANFSTPTGSTAVNVITKGMPGLMIIGEQNIFCESGKYSGVDLEGNATTKLVMQNCTANSVTANFTNPTTQGTNYYQTVTLRASRYNSLFNFTSMYSDIDSGSQQNLIFSDRFTPTAQVANPQKPYGAGVSTIGAVSSGSRYTANSGAALSLSTYGGPDLIYNAAAHNVEMPNYALGFPTTQVGNAGTYSGNPGTNMVVYTGATSGSFNISIVPTTTTEGKFIIISNPTNSSITVTNTNAGLNFIPNNPQNGTPAIGTTLTIQPYQTQMVIPANNAGTLYWAVK